MILYHSEIQVNQYSASQKRKLIRGKRLKFIARRHIPLRWPVVELLGRLRHLSKKLELLETVIPTRTLLRATASVSSTTTSCSSPILMLAMMKKWPKNSNTTSSDKLLYSRLALRSLFTSPFDGYRLWDRIQVYFSSSMRYFLGSHHGMWTEYMPTVFHKWKM